MLILIERAALRLNPGYMSVYSSCTYCLVRVHSTLALFYPTVSNSNYELLSASIFASETTDVPSVEKPVGGPPLVMDTEVSVLERTTPSSLRYEEASFLIRALM